MDEDNKPLSEVEKREKVYNLLIELFDTKQKKKDSNAAFNDEIKRIDAEIAELLEDDIDEDE